MCYAPINSGAATEQHSLYAPLWHKYMPHTHLTHTPTAAQIDGQTDRQTDGWMDRYSLPIHREINLFVK